jgi:hypothetical protein
MGFSPDTEGFFARAIGIDDTPSAFNVESDLKRALQ